MSYPGSTLPPEEIRIKDGANLDAFSRLRVSTASLLISAIFDTGDRPNHWSEIDSGGASAATFNSTGGVMELTLGTVAGHKIVRQTKEFFVYRSGHGQQVLMTFSMNAPKVNLRQRVGYFFYDGSTLGDGIFLEVNGTSQPTLNIMSSTVTGAAAPTTNSVSQADWNLDPLDGSGASGYVLDLTKVQILFLDFQWLGVGRVRCGFDVDGKVIYVHEFNHANSVGTRPYMRTGKLPLRYEIENLGVTSSGSTLTQICATVNREGILEEPGIQRTVFADLAAAATSTTTLRTVLGIRLKASNIRATLRILSTTIQNLDTQAGTWMLLLNPTGMGLAVWSDVPGQDSIAQYSRSQINVPVDGAGVPNGSTAVTLAGGALPGGGSSQGGTSTYSLFDTLPVVSDAVGTPDEAWLCWRHSTANGTLLASITYKEIR